MQLIWSSITATVADVSLIPDINGPLHTYILTVHLHCNKPHLEALLMFISIIIDSLEQLKYPHDGGLSNTSKMSNCQNDVKVKKSNSWTKGKVHKNIFTDTIRFTYVMMSSLMSHVKVVKINQKYFLNI